MMKIQCGKEMQRGGENPKQWKLKMAEGPKRLNTKWWRMQSSGAKQSDGKNVEWECK